MKVFFQLSICFLLSGSLLAQESSFKRKYVNHTEFGGLFGRVKSFYGYQQNAVESKASITAQTYNGLQLNKRLSAGVTAGMDWYKTALVNPLAAGIRYDLFTGKSARLFGTLDAGYGFTWFHQDSDGYKTKGGWMLNPGIGVKYGKPGGNAFTIVFSYKRQELHVDKPLWYDQQVRFEDRIYNRLALRLGMYL